MSDQADSNIPGADDSPLSLAGDLSDFRGGDESPLPEEGQFEQRQAAPLRTRPSARRKPLFVVLASAAMAAVITGVILSACLLVCNWRLADSEARLRAKLAVAQQQSPPQERASKDPNHADRYAYLADLRLIDRSLEQGRYGRAEDLLMSQPEDLRCWVWYWHLARSRQQTSRLVQQAAAIRDLRVSPNGQRVAVLEADRFRCWDTATEECIAEWTALAATSSFAWSPDGGFVVIAKAQMLTMYDLGNQSVIWQREHEGGRIAHLSWSGDAKWLAGATDNRSVLVWDAGSGEQAVSIEVPARPYAVDWRPNQDHLAIACRKHLLVWDLADRKFVATKQFPGWEGPFTVAWSPDGSRLAYGSGHADFLVEIWDVARDVTQTMRGHVDEVRSVRWSPDGSQLASASYDRTIRIWDTALGEAIQILEGHRRRVTRLDWSGSSNRLYSAGDDGLVNVWRTDEPNSLAVVLGKHGGGVERVKWSPDGTRLVSSGWDRSVYVWKADTAGRVAEIQRTGGHSTTRAAWSKDSRRLAVSQRVGEEQRTEIILYDALLGEQLQTLAAVPFLVEEVEWSEDEQLIAVSGQSSSVYVFDAVTGAELHCWKASTDRVQDLAWSPDSQLVALCGQSNRLQIWDAVNGQLRAELGTPGTGVQAGVCWSPDGHKIASANNSGAVQIWDLATETVEQELWGHRGAVITVDWSPDGRLLASGGQDGEIRIWSATTGAELLTLPAHSRSVRSVAWSPNGQRLASGGWDDAVRIWDATSGYEIAAERSFTPASSAAWEAEALSALNSRLSESPDDLGFSWHKLAFTVFLDSESANGSTIERGSR